MEQKTFAVIGAQYGDEGKGLIVDFLVSKLIAEGYDPVVVRANGGAQAAHTVDDGERRHVFHHFGSGTLLGASTHLTRDFIVNPIMFNREYDELAGICLARPEVSIDPDALVTLPCDMLINQIVETVRGNDRHGSCGLGINETIERSTSPMGFRLTFFDLNHIRDVAPRIRVRCKTWVEFRLKQHGIDTIPPEFEGLLDNDDIFEQFWNDCQTLCLRASVREDFGLKDEGALVFEGAQGLGLDQDHKNFPHVTRSNTGLPNISNTCVDAQRGPFLDVIYVTRCYTTRHGAGPLNHEQDISSYITVDDPTNVPNDWQGTLRFAPLDLDVLRDNIHQDLRAPETYGRFEIRPSLAVTCLDQVVEGPVHGYRIPSMIYGHAFDMPRDNITAELYTHTGIPCTLTSWGPTREHVREVKLRINVE